MYKKEAPDFFFLARDVTIYALVDIKHSKQTNTNIHMYIYQYISAYIW